MQVSADSDTTAAVLCTWGLLVALLGARAAEAASLVLQHLRVVDRAGELMDLGVAVEPLRQPPDHARIEFITGSSLVVRTRNGCTWGPDVESLHIVSIGRNAA
jgi:hypothetical protein